MDTVKLIGIIVSKWIDQIIDILPELLVHQSGSLKLWSGQIEMTRIADSHLVLFQLLIQCSHIIFHSRSGDAKLFAQLVDL